METEIKNLIPETVALLGKPRNVVSTLPRTLLANKPVTHPLKNPWQRKWLHLDCTAPALQRLADVAEAFCGRWFRNDPQKSLLVLVGPYGCGKTHVAKCVYHYARAGAMVAFASGAWGVKRCPSAQFIKWPEVANEFNQKNFSALDLLDGVELLVLDDIGAENDPWKICADKLCQVLSRRERMFTVITTNIVPAKWEELFDGRIADRLLRNSVVVDLSGVKSYALR